MRIAGPRRPRPGSEDSERPSFGAPRCGPEPRTMSSVGHPSGFAVPAKSEDMSSDSLQTLSEDMSLRLSVFLGHSFCLMDLQRAGTC